MEQILSIPLAFLSGSTIDLITCATPKRFRFIKCFDLLSPSHGKLEIYVTPVLSEHSYIALSYIWSGERHICDRISECRGSFNIVGGRDPISIDMLITAG